MDPDSAKLIDECDEWSVEIASSTSTPATWKEIAKLFDSAAPYLALKDSDQWGQNVWEEVQSFENAMKAHTEASEQQERDGVTLEGNRNTWQRVYVAKWTPKPKKGEEAPGPELIGAMVLTGRASQTVRPSVIGAQDYVYVRWLVRESTGATRTRFFGVGAALLRHAANVARAEGATRLCTDCWGGDGGMLVDYFEGQEFEVLGRVDGADFYRYFEEDEDERPWHGKVMEMKL